MPVLKRRAETWWSAARDRSAPSRTTNRTSSERKMRFGPKREPCGGATFGTGRPAVARPADSRIIEWCWTRSELVGVLADPRDQETLPVHALDDAHHVHHENADPQAERQHADDAAQREADGVNDESDNGDGNPEDNLGHHQHDAVLG